MADQLSIILADPQQRERLEKRFWAKVDRSHGPEACWPWMASIAGFGYGRFNCGDKHIEAAHRVAWALAHGHPPKPCGLHVCDNPPCCNPAHLFEGTRADNTHDMMMKGRRVQPPFTRPAATRCKRGHELTVANTFVWKGDGKRSCRKCRNDRQRLRYHGKKLED